MKAEILGSIIPTIMERLRYLPNPMEALVESTPLGSVAIRLAVLQQLRMSTVEATKHLTNADRENNVNDREKFALEFILSNPDPVKRALKTIAGGYHLAYKKTEPNYKIIGAKINSARIYAAHLKNVDQAHDFFSDTALERAADNLGYMAVPPDVWNPETDQTHLYSLADVDRYSADNLLITRNRTPEQITDSINSALTKEPLPQWFPKSLISKFANDTAAYLSDKVNLDVFNAVIAALSFDTVTQSNDPQAALKLALVGARIIPALSDDPDFVKDARLKHLETLIVISPQNLVGARRFYKTGNPDDFFNTF